jgi:hypothetical protein
MKKTYRNIVFQTNVFQNKYINILKNIISPYIYIMARSHRQFITLHKGDIITLNSYQPSSISLHTMVNAGGNLLGQNAVFMAFKLSPICEPVVCPPCPPKACPKPKKN